MTDAAERAARTAQRLERMAELNLAAVEHVHARLLATTEPAEVADLARAYQRVERGCRQALMLNMRHDAAAAEAEARARAKAESQARAAPTPRDRMTDVRTTQLQDAVGRVAAAAWPDKPRLQREALDRLDVIIDGWDAEDDDRLLLDRLDDLVVEVCESLGLPLALARRWEELPEPPQTFDPAAAAAPETEAGPAVPSADTG